MLVEKILKAIKRLRKIDLSQLPSDEDLQAQVFWYLYTIVQGTIDVAIKFISRLDLESPGTYADVFRILEKEKIISKELTERLIPMAKFRNVLAHMYFGLDLVLIMEIIKNNLDDIEEFLAELKKAGEMYNIDIFQF